MTNIEDLFDKSNIKNKIANQKRFEAKMIHKIPKIVYCIESAFSSMTRELNGKSPAYLSHLSRSVRMNEQIKGHLMDNFGSDIKKLKHNRFGLFSEGYVVLFKKLDKNGKPSNIKTGNSLLLTGQGKLNFPGEPEIVHIGYVVDAGWHGIDKIKAVKIENQQVQWQSNLKALSATSTIYLPAKPIVRKDEIEVGPKTKKRATG